MLYLTNVNAQTNEVKFNNLDERLTELELKSSRSKVRVNMELKNSYGHFKVKGRTNNNINYSAHHGHSIFRLLFSGTLNEQVSLYSSLQAVYNYNDTLQTGQTDSNRHIHQAKGVKPEVRTAYVDYRLTNYPLIFSVGRLPTTNGPPNESRDDIPRQGTYPMNVYSIPFDGIATTWNIHESFNLKNQFIFRAVYFPISAVDRQNLTSPTSRSQSDANKLVENSSGYTAMFEFRNKPKNRSKWKEFLAVAQWLRYNLGAFKSTEVRGLLNSQFPGDNDLYLLEATDTKMASIDFLSLHLQWEEILNSKFDFYVGYQKQFMQARGKAQYTIIDDRTGGSPLPVDTTRSLGDYLTGSGDQQSYRASTGLKYSFSNDYQLGAEFMKSSKFNLPTGYYDDDIVKMNAIIGDSYHLFFNYKLFGNSANLRPGYFYTRESSKFIVTTFSDAAQKASTFYLNFNVKI